MAAGKTIRRVLLLTAIAAVAGTCAWVGYRTWPRPLPAPPDPAFPRVALREGRLALLLPFPVVAADVAHYSDELLAYLNFEYLRSVDGVNPSNVLLTAKETPNGPQYFLHVLVDSNLLTCVPFLERLQSQHYIDSFQLYSWTRAELVRRQGETQLFIAAYNRTVHENLDSLTAEQLISPMARFLYFKSKTDRRIRAGDEPPEIVLSQEQANQLAADILAVAKFYDLPLDFFLGIGAMENNYMNVTGDLWHTVWKRRAQRGDIILRRRGRRVLVSNYSIGVWQITRETLRYAHKLYLKDEKKRDYSLLPERLRPESKLDLNSVDSRTLTTYAGLLLRDLLDRFDGNVEKAVGAYNGGYRNPNPDYAASVKTIAEYARRILGQAAVLNGRAIAETRFSIGRRPPEPAPGATSP